MPRFRGCHREDRITAVETGGMQIPVSSHEDQQSPGRPEALLFRYPAKEVHKTPEEDVKFAVKDVHGGKGKEKRH